MDMGGKEKLNFDHKGLRLIANNTVLYQPTMP